jgi:hypothetical protein
MLILSPGEALSLSLWYLLVLYWTWNTQYIALALQIPSQQLQLLACACYAKFVWLARTIYIRCMYGIFGLEFTKYTVYVYVYIRFWPTLQICKPSRAAAAATPEQTSVIQCVSNVFKNHGRSNIHICFHNSPKGTRAYKKKFSECGEERLFLTAILVVTGACTSRVCTHLLLHVCVHILCFTCVCVYAPRSCPSSWKQRTHFQHTLGILPGKNPGKSIPGHNHSTIWHDTMLCP